MKTIYIIVVSLFMLTTSESSIAQNTIISDFSIESNDFSIDDETINIASTITKQGSTITWTQIIDGSNTLITEFNITEASGTWDSNNSLGNIVFSIELDGFSSLLTLIGANNTVSLKINTVGVNNTPEELSFQVNSIVYL